MHALTCIGPRTAPFDSGFDMVCASDTPLFTHTAICSIRATHGRHITTAMQPLQQHGVAVAVKYRIRSANLAVHCDDCRCVVQYHCMFFKNK